MDDDLKKKKIPTKKKTKQNASEREVKWVNLTVKRSNFHEIWKKSELKFEKNGATVWLTRKKNSFEKNFCGREIFWSADDDFAAEFRSAVGYVDR